MNPSFIQELGNLPGNMNRNVGNILAELNRTAEIDENGDDTRLARRVETSLLDSALNAAFGQVEWFNADLRRTLGRVAARDIGVLQNLADRFSPMLPVTTSSDERTRVIAILAEQSERMRVARVSLWEKVIVLNDRPTWVVAANSFPATLGSLFSDILIYVDSLSNLVGSNDPALVFSVPEFERTLSGVAEHAEECSKAFAGLVDLSKPVSVTTTGAQWSPDSRLGSIVKNYLVKTGANGNGDAEAAPLQPWQLGVRFVSLGVFLSYLSTLTEALGYVERLYEQALAIYSSQTEAPEFLGNFNLARFAADSLGDFRQVEPLFTKLIFFYNDSDNKDTLLACNNLVYREPIASRVRQMLSSIVKRLRVTAADISDSNYIYLVIALGFYVGGNVDFLTGHFRAAAARDRGQDALTRAVMITSNCNACGGKKFGTTRARGHGRLFVEEEEVTAERDERGGISFHASNAKATASASATTTTTAARAVNLRTSGNGGISFPTSGAKKSSGDRDKYNEDVRSRNRGRGAGTARTKKSKAQPDVFDLLQQLREEEQVMSSGWHGKKK